MRNFYCSLARILTGASILVMAGIAAFFLVTAPKPTARRPAT